VMQRCAPLRGETFPLPKTPTRGLPWPSARRAGRGEGRGGARRLFVDHAGCGGKCRGRSDRRPHEPFLYRKDSGLAPRKPKAVEAAGRECYNETHEAG
jgi:hypothetical protein